MKKKLLVVMIVAFTFVSNSVVSREHGPNCCQCGAPGENMCTIFDSGSDTSLDCEYSD